MFLVCTDILHGLDTAYYIKREGSKVTITIPNGEGRNYEAEVFSFDDFPMDSFKKGKNILLENVSVTISDNETSITHNVSEPGTVYALLRFISCIPDDVFIKRSHSRHFELIKKIDYITSEADYGSYKALVYFVKISLEPGDYVHIYFADDNANFLEKHIAFYCWDENEIIFKDNLKTFIKNDDTEFISLSELNSDN